MPPSRAMSASSVGWSTTMAVGSSRPRITLRGSKESATLGAVATTWLMSLVTLSPLITSRIGWLSALHSTNTRSAWTRILPAGVSNSWPSLVRRKSRSIGPASSRSATAVVSTAAIATMTATRRLQTRTVLLTNARHFRVLDDGARPIYPSRQRMSWLSTAQLPRPHDKKRLAVAWTRWNEKTARSPDRMSEDPTGVALLDALFGNSPYLAETVLQSPTFMTDLWRDGPDTVVPRLAAELAEARAAARDGAKPEAVAAALRRLKRQQALAIAVADIAGVW